MDESKETQMRDSPLPLSLSVVLDNIDTGIAIYDAKGNFVFINTVMVNWRNIPRNEYLTMNIHDFSNYLDIHIAAKGVYHQMRSQRGATPQTFGRICGVTVRIKFFVFAPGCFQQPLGVEQQFHCQVLLF